jgi:hypothetical protein
MTATHTLPTPGDKASRHDPAVTPAAYAAVAPASPPPLRPSRTRISSSVAWPTLTSSPTPPNSQPNVAVFPSPAVTPAARTGPAPIALRALVTAPAIAPVAPASSPDSTLPPARAPPQGRIPGRDAHSPYGKPRASSRRVPPWRPNSPLQPTGDAARLSSRTALRPRG